MGTQISKMTPEPTLPNGGVVPFVVPPETVGFDSQKNYIYDLGADLLTRVSYAALALPDAAASVGSTDGNVQTDIDARPTSAVLASSDGDEMIGLEVGGKLRDAVRVLTPAMYGVPNDGDEDTDVTTELEAMALASRTLEYPVLFAARKYVYSTEAITFGGNVSGSGTGAGSTLLSCTNTGVDAYALRVSAPGSVVENLRIDGNVSADPPSWNSGNYDSFTGAQGLIVDADEVTVRNVVAQNCRRAGIKVQAGRKGWILENVRTNRTRGTFGDGFFIVGTQQGKLTNCRAYDFTRIGFVVDSYGDPTTPSIQIGLDNCRAEYGHDASILYGGGEYNSGYWSELAGHVVFNNCHAKDTNQRGFIATSGATILGVPTARYTFVNCTVDGAQDGFITYGLSGVPVSTLFENCYAKVTGNTAFVCGVLARDVVRSIGCGSSLSGTTAARTSVKAGPGETYIEGFEETWEVTNTTYRDDPAVHYGGLGHFADATGKVVVADWKTFDNTGTRVPSTVKFLSTAAASLDLSMERMWIRGLVLNGIKIRTKEVDWTRLGSIDCPDVIMDTGSNLETDSIYTLAVRSTTKQFLFRNYRFDFTASASWLAFFNVNNVSADAKLAFEGCGFIKNFETGNRAIRYEAAAGATAAATGACNILLNGNAFTNTGGATTNEAVTIVTDVDAGGLVNGQGNKKSSTITNTATAGRTSASFSCTAWGS